MTAQITGYAKLVKAANAAPGLFTDIEQETFELRHAGFIVPTGEAGRFKAFCAANNLTITYGPSPNRTFCVSYTGPIADMDATFGKVVKPASS